ncbi:MAG TPA: hypothetical protein VF232_11895 [Gaiellaceae bacterium]
MTRPAAGVHALVRVDLMFLGLAGVLGSATIAAGMTNPTVARLTLALAALWLLASLGFAAPRSLLYVLIGWLAVLGFARRVASVEFAPGHTDPLLLVEPVAVGVLLLAAIGRGGLAMRSTLSKVTLALALLLLAGSLNPAQGGIATGLAGLLFALVPVCGFWIGRAFCDDATYARILRLVAVLGALAAAYGLSQTFSGFPSWDEAWIRDQGYSALSVGGVTRAFGSFSSASEYASFVAIALLVWLARGFRTSRAMIAVPIVALLGTALLYESSRGIMFKLPVALVLILAARARQPLALSLAAAAAAIVILPVVVSSFVPASGAGGGASSPLLQHQLTGLANPLDPSASTLAVHASLVGNGFATAFREPLGVGTGAVTIAGQKFGGKARNTEADPSNAAVALGIPGLIAYVVLLCAAVGQAYRLAARRRDWLSAIALGLLVVTLLEWLTGGQYAVAFLLWLTLGWIDRTSDESNGALVEGRA